MVFFHNKKEGGVYWHALLFLIVLISSMERQRNIEVIWQNNRFFNYLILHTFAPVAQWIEHWIPNPCAASSILAGGTNNIKEL